jgi:hypothetical protein
VLVERTAQGAVKVHIDQRPTADDLSLSPPRARDSATGTHKKEHAMRFRSLSIKNLRAIREFSVTDLTDFIVIAGPNGCGKSCVFDAARLLKSVYGGYAAGEHMQWFGELGVVVQDPRALKGLFRNPEQPIEVRAHIEFDETEKEYMRGATDELLWPIAWQHATGQQVDHWNFSRLSVATQLAQYESVVRPHLVAMRTQLLSDLEADTHEISLTLPMDGELGITPCLPAQVSFGAFEPQRLGIIEYHSASRAYIRQPLQGINLDARAFEDQRRQQSLYNWQGKYQNVKTELASGYLRSLIKSQAEAPDDSEDINETMKALFRTFFPDKQYLGVRPLPHGSLEFPVQLPGGETHDIDELSSGEKEILYGYLRLRNSTPKHSVILLDEPELHLNPSLLQGFADFYHRYLGQAQNNQLWLVTHSDTLLRQAVGNSNYSVFHMLNAGTEVEGNQASQVYIEDDVERVTIDLVGDLAAYRPHSKVVVLEGVNADAFDELMIRRLFPDFARRVNLVSGGHKQRVRDLYGLLSGVQGAGILDRFYAITDKDFEPSAIPTEGTHVFSWDAYHIENYLLDADAIREAAAAVAHPAPFASNGTVEEALRKAAEKLVLDLVLQRVQADLNREVISSISLRGKLSRDGDVFTALEPSISASKRRVEAAFTSLDRAYIDSRAEAYQRQLSEALASNLWIKEFPGREVLKRFVADNLNGVNYESFRNLILDKFAAAGKRPPGMQAVIDRILL